MLMVTMREMHVDDMCITCNWDLKVCGVSLSVVVRLAQVDGVRMSVMTARGSNVERKAK